MTVLDKIKAFSKRYQMGFSEPKPEAKGAEKMAAEPPETKVAEAPEKKVGESSSKQKNGSCQGKPGCWGVFLHQLNLSTHSSRIRSPGVNRA